MHSDRDKEPEDDELLPHGDDFVSEHWNQICWKKLTKLFPFPTWQHFCYQDNSTLNYTKTNHRDHTYY